MKIDLTSVARLLEDHPAPALPLDRLARALARQSRRLKLTPEELREALESRPELFRILDPWQGPWRALLRRVAPSGDEYRREFDAWATGLDTPWVVLKPGALASRAAPARERRGPRFPRARSSAAGPRKRERPRADSRTSTPGPSPAGAGPSSGAPAGPSPGRSREEANPDHPPQAARSPGLRRLRETVRWCALMADTGSAASVARWSRMASQEREVREALMATRFAPPAGPASTSRSDTGGEAGR